MNKGKNTAIMNFINKIGKWAKIWFLLGRQLIFSVINREMRRIKLKDISEMWISHT
jgi:hypothetical protein